MAKKIAIVYQAGICNLFEVGNFGHTAKERGKVVRLLQHAFLPCEWYARGARDTGATVKAYGCNMAGDISGEEWSDDRGPFREQTRWPEDKKPDMEG